MHVKLSEVVAPRHRRRSPAAATTTMLLAIAFGLCGGYLDVGFTVLRKFCFNIDGHFRNAADFPWTVPLGHAALMLVPGALVVLVSQLRPVPVSLRTQSWLFATLAVWSALLRLPLDGKYSLVLAAGLGRVVSSAITARCLSPRRGRFVVASLVGVLAVLAVTSLGWQAVREYRARRALPPSAQNARNVVLIVWDTVRAEPEHLRLWPRYHAQPGAMGPAEGGYLSSSPSRLLHGPSRHMPPSLPANGLSRPVARTSSFLTPRDLPWRNSSGPRATRQRGSPPTQAVAATNSAWVGALTISRITRSRRGRSSPARSPATGSSRIS